jgi:hypothetical protein
MAKFTADEFFKLPNPKRPDRRKNINSVKQIIDLKFGDKTGFSAIRLKGADGKDYKISNLNKSKEFGGGGGSRG